MSTDVSEEYVALIFRVEEATCFTMDSCLLYSSTLKMKACSSETSIDIQRTTRHYIPEDRNLYILICLESFRLKSIFEPEILEDFPALCSLIACTKGSVIWLGFGEGPIGCSNIYNPYFIMIAGTSRSVAQSRSEASLHP
jgi:hypothetical protein